MFISLQFPWATWCAVSVSDSWVKCTMSAYRILTWEKNTEYSPQKKTQNTHLRKNTEYPRILYWLGLTSNTSHGYWGKYVEKRLTLLWRCTKRSVNCCIGFESGELVIFSISERFTWIQDLNCVTRAPILYFLKSWVALSFKVVSLSVCQSGIGNTCPDLHFVQYIKA